MHGDLQRLCQSLLDGLSEAGGLRTDLDLKLEAERLHGLIDGLSLHVTIRPEKSTPARVRKILRAHLDSLQPGSPNARH